MKLLVSAVLAAAFVASTAAISREAASGVFPVSPALCAEMRVRNALHRDAPIGCDRLRLVRFGYLGFDSALHDDGEIMVMDAVANYVLDIFASLRSSRFPIEKAKLINQYDGSDERSMAENNTSGFNDRAVAGTGSLSMHAYGLAIDLNPIQNPYLERNSRGETVVDPPSGMRYADRGRWPAERKSQLGMAEAAIEIFADHGFTVWGGNWRNQKDYQHFQVARSLAGTLVRLPAPEAAALFDRYVASYRACRAAGRSRLSCS